MTVALRPMPEALSEADALAAIAARAQATDAEAGTQIGGLGPDLALLASSGILAGLTLRNADPRVQATLLRRIGRANLSVGRLAEGHMNALRLVSLYGDAAQCRRHFAAAARGAIYGVWGADDTRPLGIASILANRVRLSGRKRYASGLGVVGCAVATVASARGAQLVLAPTDDPTRADASSWRTSGMRATASGTYDFDGVEAELVGRAGDYEREPYFEGGVWRYAALHVGGLEALAEEVRAVVAAQGDAAGETQLHRVARMAILAHGARLMVEDAAARVEAPGAGIEATALSLAAREAVETACLDGIALADRALGARSFSQGAPAERIRRDLGFFLRQANLDGKLALSGRTLCLSLIHI